MPKRMSAFERTFSVDLMLTERIQLTGSFRLLVYNIGLEILRKRRPHDALQVSPCII
jgi:hypothetical protein